MPYSKDVFDVDIAKIVCALAPESALDIGAGAGKNGRILREQAPDAHSTAVEIEIDYVKKFELDKLYSKVLIENAENLIDKMIEDSFDIVIFGDSIEHMRKSVGIDLLNFFIYRSKLIVVCYPERFLQNSHEGYKHEAHISAWSPVDFVNFPSKTMERGKYKLTIIEGFLCPPDRWQAVETTFQACLSDLP